MTTFSLPFRRALLVTIAAGLGALGLTAPAHAYYLRRRVFVAAPVVVAAPPVVFAPPAVYAAAPVVAFVPPPPTVLPAPVALPVPSPFPGPATPAAAPAPTLLGRTCYAGAYVCPLPQLQQVGSGCSCPGLGAPSYGMVR